MLAYCCFHIHPVDTEHFIQTAAVSKFGKRERLNIRTVQAQEQSQKHSSWFLLNLGTNTVLSFSCITGYGLSVLLISFQYHALCHAGKDKPNSVGHMRFVLCDIGITHHARLTAELPWKQISRPHSDSMFWGLLRNLFWSNLCIKL